MKRIIVFMWLSFWWVLPNFAQNNGQTAYNDALERIAEAKASNAWALDLSFFSLSELPPEIGELDNLVELDLMLNSLTSLPPEIGNLTNLQRSLVIMITSWKIQPGQKARLHSSSC